MSGPMTAIWALIGQGPWKAKAVHWNNINYPAEKNKKGTNLVRQQPDFIGDVATLDGKAITTATVEGKLLKIDFKPFIVTKTNQDKPAHTFTFIIDPLAAHGPQGRPVYDDGELARVAGWASHVDNTTKAEVVKPIYRDNFAVWGHLKEDGPKMEWEIKPMYFITHGKSIIDFTEPRDTYAQFNKTTSPTKKWEVVPLMEGVEGETGSDDNVAENATTNEGGFVMATGDEEIEFSKGDKENEDKFDAETAKESEQLDKDEQNDSDKW